MTAAIVRFPLRQAAAIFVSSERDGDGWLTLAGDHGWLHGDRASALDDAAWLSTNLGLPIRVVTARAS